MNGELGMEIQPPDVGCMDRMYIACGGRWGCVRTLNQHLYYIPV